jgi:predicted permease
MRTFLQDLRYGLRLLRKSPWFAAAAVFTLALGIAANTTGLTWVDGVMHPLLGGADVDRLVAFETIMPNGEYSNTSYRDHQDYREGLTLLSGLTVWTQAAVSVGAADHPDLIWGELVSGNYFSVFGVKANLGRVFGAGEYSDAQGAHAVAVISERLWRNQFHSDPGVIGKPIRVNRHELTIIGVVPGQFRGGTFGLTFDIWVPLTMAYDLRIADESMLTSRTWRGLFAVGRLKSGAAIEQARAEVAVEARRLAATYPKTNQGIGATLLPLRESPTGAQALMLRPLQILMAVCVVVLLIACANVTNLLLARSIARQRELGIRLALGANSGRIVRQLLVETLLLAVGGTLLGLPLSLWMGESLRWLVPPTDLPVQLDIRLNWRILAFSILTCVLATLFSGVAPALLSIRSKLVETLKEGGRGGGQGAHSHRLRGTLVVAEIALAAVALIGAVVFMRSFEKARAVYPGFDPGNVLLSQFYLPGYTPDQAKQFAFRLRERLGSLPGITAATYADTVMLGFSGDAGNDIEIPGYAPGPNERMNFSRTLVAPGYFDIMRIPVLEGRDFTEADDEQSTPVLIVNQTFARRFFGETNPLGRKVRVSAGTVFTVIGLARDIKYRYLNEPPQPYFYMAFKQRFYEGRNIAFFLHTSGNPREAIAALRREAAAVDPTAAALDTIPLSEYITATLYPQKVAARLLSALGLISLLLSAVGLYSVVNYAVSQRTREIGIRMALGAQPGDVVKMVLRQGLLLTLGGLLAGVGAGLVFTRMVASMLLDISPADPLTFAAAALLLGTVTLLASYIPARRAARVDPMVALRDQ